MNHNIIIAGFFFLVTGCSGSEVQNNKDLNQNMLDIRIYQENLGEHLRQNRLKEGSWLLEDMDSILLLLNRQFREHRKLSAPFSHYYEKELKEPINNIREAMAAEDSTKALQHYRILINNCNGCHIDHEIDKKVKY